MLSSWLARADWNGRPFSGFDVFAVTESHECDPSDRDHLASLVLASRTDPGFIAEAADRFPERYASARIASPVGRSMRRGKFGEVVTAALLEELEEYAIPVTKLRYDIDPEQSQPGTDVVAFDVDVVSETIVGVVYAESKLRTTFTASSAVDAYLQLKEDADLLFADILMFIAERLHERGDSFLEMLDQYLHSRDELTDIDRFRVFLVFDSAIWKEDVLDRLEAFGIELDNLTVDVVLLDSLAELIDDVCSLVGIPEVINDE